MDVDLRLGLVTVDTVPEKVTGKQIVEVIDSTCDSSHCFKAKLKSETDVESPDC